MGYGNKGPEAIQRQGQMDKTIEDPEQEMKPNLRRVS
jgi:hypothetical protein